MSSALFGILQLEKGEPLGYANVVGLIQGWLQDAGGFAMVGLIVYLLYALLTPTDKSESERIRVPVTQWMVGCAGLALICFAAYFALFALLANNQASLFGMPTATPELPPPPPGTPAITPPPAFHSELQPILFMIGGLFALLGLGEPFARDMVRIFHRNFSLRFRGVQQFAKSATVYVRSLSTSRRVKWFLAGVVAYIALGVAAYASDIRQLLSVYLGITIVLLAVQVVAILVLLLFEAEGPIWAIAKLSFKEVARNQVLWIFLLIFLPFMFPWFGHNNKPSDELRIVVERVTLFSALFVLFPALLLACFYGISNDIKNLNIYTVVSKPVERFEIVLGRFVGRAALMTLVLVAFTGVSLVFITNMSLSEKAREETYKARVPIRGNLEFKSLKAQFRNDKVEFTGTNVGREFDYRRYLVGHPESMHRAIWQFSDLPKHMASAAGDRVPVEFTFDIFKLTKGEQNKGAAVSFRFVTFHAPQEQPELADRAGAWHWQDRAKEKAYDDAVSALVARGLNPASAVPGTPAWDAVNKLAEEFGCYEFRNKQVLDYQVMSVEMPTGLIRNAMNGTPPKVKDPKTGKDVPGPRLSVYVKCETPGQMLGVAEPDLYLLEYEQPFALNYIKGMVGLWCWMCIIIGLAVTCSTYLSGVLSLLVVGVLFVAGFFTDFITELSANRNVGGGPLQSISQMMRAEQPTMPMADTAGTKAVILGDHVLSWFMRRIQNIIPDLELSDWADFVSEGYNVNTEYLFVSVLVTFGYLLPWAILAYYLMKTREVAA